MNKKLLGGVVAAVAIAVVVTALLTSAYYTSLNIYGSAGLDFEVGSIHANIIMTRNGVEVFHQYHAGAMTNLGANLTMAKLTGNLTGAYNATTYMLNTTWISIGNAGTLNAASTVLPGEWNRTTTTMHDCTYNSFNLTAVFSGTTGTQTADCIGINYETGIGKDGTLWGYDTFTEVTGIDSTFTITIEFKISVS